MVVHWDLVDDLHDDVTGIRHIQDASVNRSDAGFPPTPYLFGTSEWWRAIETGAIEHGSVEGVDLGRLLGKHGRQSKTVLRIWIESSPLRTPYYKGHRGSAEPDPDLIHGVHTFLPTADEPPEP
jgi:hypothetical protein